MSYTAGNWTGEFQYVDSLSNPKSLSVPDFSFDTDFSVSSRNANEVRLANTTGNSMILPEELSMARARVQDIYQETPGIPANYRYPITNGYRAAVRLIDTMKYTNSVSGEEIMFPVKAAITVTVPASDLITEDVLLAILKRVQGLAYQTGKTDGSLLLSLMRGDLDPIS